MSRMSTRAMPRARAHHALRPNRALAPDRPPRHLRGLGLALGFGLLVAGLAGCANRRWGMPGGQGTIERQKARATLHDPYPLNDIGPEVVGGRPREFYSPQAEPAREHALEGAYPNMYGYQ